MIILILLGYNNQITDITPLANLTNLTKLWLSDNRITDLAPLVANAGLGMGDSIILWDNPPWPPWLS